MFTEKKEIISFVHSLSNIDDNSLVSIIGVVKKRKHFKKKKIKVRYFTLKDITGEIEVFLYEDESLYNSWSTFQVGNILKVTGLKKLKNNEKPILKNIKKINVLPDYFKKNNKNNYNGNAAKLLVCKVIDEAKEEFKKENFFEIDCKLISTSNKYGTLEPLKVVYPGLGGYVFLAISPAPQLLQFLIDSHLESVYCVSKSFSSSYRFQNASAELNVVMGKTIKFRDKNEVIRLFRNFFSRLNIELSTSIREVCWSNRLKDYIQISKPSIFNYSCKLPVLTENWDSEGIAVIQVKDSDSIIYAEAFIEVITNSSTIITTITFYPDQILALIKESPERYIQNLMQVYE